MIKLLVTLSLVAAVYCGPLNAALNEADDFKHDTGVVDEQPQNDGKWLSTYMEIQRRYNMLRNMQREVGMRAYKGVSPASQQEARPANSKGTTATQREARPSNSKGQMRQHLLQREVGEPSQQCASEKLDLEILRKTNNDLRRQRNAAQARQHTAEADNARTQQINEHLYNEKGLKEAKIQNLERQNENMMAENTMLRAEKANLEKQVEANLAEIVNLNRQVASLNAEITNLNAALESCQARRSQLETEVRQKRAEIANLNQQVEQLNGEINALKERIAELEAQVAALQTANQELTAELAETREQLDNCNKEVDNLRSNIENLNSEIANLQANINTLNAENAKLKTEKEEMTNYAADLLRQKEACEARPCPDGYSLYGTKCYKYVPQKMQWKDAQEYCMKDRANLASINSKLEQENIVQYLKSEMHVTDNYLYVGGEELRGQWQWVTGSGFGDYHNWYHGKPVQGEKDSCLTLYMQHPKKVGKWLGMPCDIDLGFVCSHPPTNMAALLAESDRLLAEQMEALGMMNRGSSAHTKSIYVMMGEQHKK